MDEWIIQSKIPFSWLRTVNIEMQTMSQGKSVSIFPKLKKWLNQKQR